MGLTRQCLLAKSGNSSVGRAQPCQGWGREFESRFPLQFQVSQCPPESTKIRFLRSFPARWQSGYAADCNSVYAGSIPTRASISFPLFTAKKKKYEQNKNKRKTKPQKK